ncbi:MAG: hypothetical protein OXM03_03170 [Chloroflexota bacterium]|nr:hypothetical protein [Chloroflexota bacterium]MDE2839609.1 hypothetical protein [Chloroflexota bacterium]MDE2931533.1 hypothetical protein [Chloroflexota bacterium]
MESRTDDLAARLLRCPVGCAFLLTIERDQVPIELAVTPPQAFARAAIALNVLNPWSGDLERTVTAALSRGADLASLARAVVSHPQSRWWTAPMDPTRQLLVIDDTAHPASARTVPHPIWERIQRIFKRTSSCAAASKPAVRWESYAQRPREWRITSTLRGEYACLDTAIALGVGEWAMIKLHRRFAAEIDASARVCEISGPADWHELCVSFPSVNQDPNSPAGVGTLSPDWARVATQWDGVHLTFLGLLSTPFVRHCSAAGTTMLWSWDTEGTLWLPGNFLRTGTPLAHLDPDAHTFEAPRWLYDDLGIPEWPPVPGVIHYRR